MPNSSTYDHAYFAAAEQEPNDTDLVQGAPDVIVSSGGNSSAGDLLMQDMALGAFDVGCIEEITNKGEELPGVDVIAGEEEVISGAAEEERTSSCTATPAAAATSGEARPVEEEGLETDTEMCKRNLLHHILNMQDQLEERLNCMEDQLQVLEHESTLNGTESTMTEEEDMLRLKLSLKGLMKDLNAVHRLALFQ